MTLERLQKVLAAGGLGSRRACEALITAGRVTVDGRPATELGTKVDPDRQEVRCDGEVIRAARNVYYLINKPKGYVCTNADERGRPCVFDLLPTRDTRLFTVGRLDADTEGLLIVTNDGDFTQRVAHPRYGVPKTYRAQVKGAITNSAKRDLLAGVWISGERCAASWVKITKRGRSDSVVEITMHEGRNREVRRMLAKVGFPVAYLRRFRIGPLEDDVLRLGHWRKLSPEEVRGLVDAAGAPGTYRPGRPYRPSHVQHTREENQ
jgi:23S rRNA pseudouridine2605 synthase